MEREKAVYDRLERQLHQLHNWDYTVQTWNCILVKQKINKRTNIYYKANNTKGIATSSIFMTNLSPAETLESVVEVAAGELVAEAAVVGDGVDPVDGFDVVDDEDEEDDCAVVPAEEVEAVAVVDWTTGVVELRNQKKKEKGKRKDTKRRSHQYLLRGFHLGARK